MNGLNRNTEITCWKFYACLLLLDIAKYLYPIAVHESSLSSCCILILRTTILGRPVDRVEQKVYILSEQAKR